MNRMECPTVDRIKAEVCRKLRVRRKDLISDDRTAPIIRARHMAIYLCWELTPNSKPTIGRLFGNRDATSITHAVKKFALLMKKDEVIAKEVGELKAALAKSILPSPSA